MKRSSILWTWISKVCTSLFEHIVCTECIVICILVNDTITRNHMESIDEKKCIERIVLHTLHEYIGKIQDSQFKCKSWSFSAHNLLKCYSFSNWEYNFFFEIFFFLFRFQKVDTIQFVVPLCSTIIFYETSIKVLRPRLVFILFLNRLLAISEALHLKC